MINSFKSYLIEETREVYFTFGRMNPPTIGHEKLMESMAKKSGQNPYRVYLSQSQDKKKNPLHFSEKIKYARKMFPRHARQIMADKKIRNVFEAASKLYDEGYKRVNMVVGSDRVNEFKVLLNKYNGKKGRHGFYNFENINVISAGDRDPDAEGATGMSASKMRQAVMEKDFTSFSQGLPKNMSNPEAKKLYNSVRMGMGLKEQKTFLNQVKLAEVSNTRESYVAGTIFNIGDKVRIKETQQVGEIIKRGSNYVMVESNDKVFRKWLDSIELMDSIKTFKENMYQSTAKKRIDREKKRDAQKHDRMMDLARLRDASAKNKQTTVKR